MIFILLLKGHHFLILLTELDLYFQKVTFVRSIDNITITTILLTAQSTSTAMHKHPSELSCAANLVYDLSSGSCKSKDEVPCAQEVG